jgi:hypothetical protein
MSYTAATHEAGMHGGRNSALLGIEETITTVSEDI